MPRQDSFRCLDAMLADLHMDAPSPAHHSPLSANSSPTTDLESPSHNESERAGHKLRQLFRKKTPSPQKEVERESFFCADAMALEEAFKSSRDRYQGAALEAAAAAPQPAYTSYAPPPRCLMTEALTLRARQQQRLPQPKVQEAPARISRRPLRPTAAPPPVPPLPEQYRRRDVAQRS